MANAGVSALFKAGCVCMLVIQNSAIGLTMRYSRAVLHESYLTSTTVVLQEFVKLVASLIFLTLGFKLRSPVALADLPRHVSSIMLCKEGLLMSVPGFLYFLGNQLAFIGLENLDASTYSLVSQLKILSTALCARVMLGKNLKAFQWRALVLLIVGVVLVQGSQEGLKKPVPVKGSSNMPATTRVEQTSMNAADATAVAPAAESMVAARVLLQAAENAALAHPLPAAAGEGISSAVAASSSAPSSSPSSTWSSRLTGLSATILMAFLSGLTGCYVEKMLKGGSLSVWDRNVQLSVYGMCFGLVQIVLFSSPADRSFAREHGWMGGYSLTAFFVVMLGSLGGILVSLVVAYLDSIIRGFATSLAILLTSFVSFWVFGDVQVTQSFACGVATVLLAVANYQDDMSGSSSSAAGAKTDASASSIGGGSSPGGGSGSGSAQSSLQLAALGGSSIGTAKSASGAASPTRRASSTDLLQVTTHRFGGGGSAALSDSGSGSASGGLSGLSSLLSSSGNASPQMHRRPAVSPAASPRDSSSSASAERVGAADDDDDDDADAEAERRALLAR